MTENKYANGKIYEIVCKVTGLRYIGSTICDFKTRLRGHKGKYKAYLEGKGTKVSSFEIIKNGNYCINLIEAVSCESKIELEKRERYYIETIDCINKFIPNRTTKEYYEDNREAINQKSREYYNANREAIKQKRREHYEANKEAIKQKRREHYVRTSNPLPCSTTDQ